MLPLPLASWRMPAPTAISASKAASAKSGLDLDCCGGGGSEPSRLVSVSDGGPAGSDEPERGSTAMARSVPTLIDDDDSAR
jgi:hypothetical protein